MTGEHLPPPTAPYEVAGVLLADYQASGTRTLHHWRGSWMQWVSSHWTEIEDSQLRADAYKRLEGAFYINGSGEPKSWCPNKSKVTDVIDALAAHTHLPETVDAPTWLNAHTIPPSEVVACANGLLHVQTRTMGALTPWFFNRVAVPFNYDARGGQPTRWLQFLEQLWPDDPDSIAALQEFFGYILSGRTDMQKIMLLVGPTRSGKGTIARVLAELVGRGNAAGPTLASLGGNFGLSPLLGKPLAVVSDARLGGGNVHQVVERLLSVSGEDMLTVDRKYRQPWTGKLPTRFLVLSNELPRFGDASGAIAHRFIVLTLQRSFLGHENHHLTDQLLAELPGVLLWALDGLDRLIARGRFTVPQSSVDSVTALQDLVSPVSAFVRDRCIVEAGHETATDSIFAAWKEWCEDNGHRPGNTQTFGRDLRAVAPSLRATQHRTETGRYRAYQGITLRNDWHAVTRTDTRSYPTTRTRDIDPPRDNNGDDRVPARATPITCPHGTPDGHLPDQFLAGKVRCPQCRRHPETESRR
jgi:putative DNA primase/helicase